jgi:hypothetical protein
MVNFGNGSATLSGDVNASWDSLTKPKMNAGVVISIPVKLLYCIARKVKKGPKKQRKPCFRRIPGMSETDSQ